MLSYGYSVAGEDSFELDTEFCLFDILWKLTKNRNPVTWHK